MFVQMSIHHPKPETVGLLIESMHTYADALEGAPGLINVRTLHDAAAGVLVGIAMWSSKETMEASVHLGREAVKDHPFHLWETHEAVGYRLTDV